MPIWLRQKNVQDDATVLQSLTGRGDEGILAYQTVQTVFREVGAVQSISSRRGAFTPHFCASTYIKHMVEVYSDIFCIFSNNIFAIHAFKQSINYIVYANRSYFSSRKWIYS